LDALALRLSPVPIVAHGEAEAPTGEGLHAYVHVPAPTGDRYRVEIIVSDGRAYAREITAPEAMAGRILGGELALLLRGIEEGTLAPDRHDAVIPGTDDDGSTTSQAPEESVEPPHGGEPPPAFARSPRERSRPELGVLTGAGASLGVAPGTDVAASVVALGELGLEVRWPSGGAVSADVRVGGRRPSPYSLVRTRIAVGGGYVLRRSAFELPVRAWLAVEPWGVRAGGRGTPVVPIEGTARQVPLLSLVARVEPGVRVRLAGRRTPLSLRVGPYVELAAGAVFSDGVGAARLRDAGTGEVIARLGGLELGLGLCVQLWLGVERGASRGRSERAAP
jgi:hypothetical protein